MTVAACPAFGPIHCEYAKLGKVEDEQNSFPKSFLQNLPEGEEKTRKQMYPQDPRNQHQEERKLALVRDRKCYGIPA